MKMSLPTWRELYEELLYTIETELEVVDEIPHLISGTMFRGDLSDTTDGEYHCWEVTHKVPKTRYLMDGSGTLENFTEVHHYYLWLGRKGAIYRTAHPKFKATKATDSLSMMIRAKAAEIFWGMKNV